jgi:hypothetical protein
MDIASGLMSKNSYLYYDFIIYISPTPKCLGGASGCLKDEVANPAVFTGN